MYSDKIFTIKEFEDIIPQFAQTLINKVSERNQNAKLSIRQESPVSYLITIKGLKSEHYILELLSDGHVQSTSVYKF